MRDLQTIAFLNEKRIEEWANKPMRNTEVLRQIKDCLELLDAIEKEGARGNVLNDVAQIRTKLNDIYRGL